MDWPATRTRSFTNEALFSRDLAVCLELMTWMVMHPAGLSVRDHDIVHQRGVHGTPPLPLRWIFADAQPLSALSSAPVFLLIQFVPKPRPAQGTPGALASTAIACRCARVWLAARNTYGTNRTQPKTIRQTFARCALTALFLLRCLFACPRYTFWLVRVRPRTRLDRPAPGLSFFRRAWPPKSNPSAKTRPWRRTLRASAVLPRPASRCCGSPR